MTEQNFIVSIENRHPLLLANVDISLYEYDSELDNITSVFFDLSESLCQRGIFFSLKIDSVQYPVESAELSIFLEELFNLVSFVNNKEIKNYNLEFFEQGARYLLSFEKTINDSYILKFYDRDKIDFKVRESEGSLIDLNLTLFTFFCRIIFVTKRMCPSIANNDWYVNWRSSVESQFI